MADPADIAALYPQFFIGSCTIVSSAFIVFYDYVLTLPTEISVIWKSDSGFNGAQALFFVTRYSYQIAVALELAQKFASNNSAMFCRVTGYVILISLYLAQIGLRSILALRIYAIYRRNFWILLVLGLQGVSSLAITMFPAFAYIRQIPNDPQIGIAPPCLSSVALQYYRFQTAQSALSLVFSITVFGLTFAKTYRHVLEMRKADLRNGLAYYILRDGTMYFLANMLLSVSVVTINMIRDVDHFWSVVIGNVGNATNISLISRLVLNLREVSHMQVDNVAIRTIKLEPEFATNSLLGNLGAPLRIGAEEEFMEEIQEYHVVPDGDM